VTAPLTVRVAEEADLAALDLAVPSGRNDVHRGFLARQAVGDASYLVAWRDGNAVGVGVVRWIGRGGYPDPEISNLRVPEHLQSQGIGTAIVHFAEDLVRARGYRRIVIGVDEDNRRAEALYERLGYTDTGARWTGTYTWYDETGTEREEIEHVRVLSLPLR
jgi:ribosomal protein S18 acetylase RimI-like enzyme